MGLARYDVAGSFRYPTSVATTPAGSLVVQYYSDAACTAPLGGIASFGLSNSGSPADTWVTATYPSGLTTPVGTVAVLIYLRFTTSAAGAAHGWYDDIRFTPTPLGGPLPGPFPLFPRSNWWNLDISAAPLDPASAAFITFIGGATPLHPDFGGDVSPGSVQTYGFPYVVVSGAQAKKAVSFATADESDGVDHSNEQSFPFYPVPDEAITQNHWIEGGDPGNVDLRGSEDRHLLIVDTDNRYLYELYNVFYDATPPGQWLAGSGAFFDMSKNHRRPETWTSADAAGLAILPGLVRYEEVFGTAEIGHAFRVTVLPTNGYVYPASHVAGSTAGAVPMGARLRLKAGKDISSFTPEVQRIFRAMKKYGLIVADNGTNMYVSGTYDTRWDNDVLNPAFGALTANDFEVVQRGFGVPTDLKLADFEGDRSKDIAVYHAASGMWFIRSSSTGTTTSLGYGGPAYQPVPADYDGDGKADIAVYHPPSGLWFIRSSATGTDSAIGFGGTGYAPVRGDFDGDGKADLAVFHDATGLWFIRNSSTGSVTSLGFGASGYVPVPGDYDGDGKTDIAVYHPPSGLWFIRNSSTLTTTTVGFGGTGYAPVRGDFDGDGRTDVAVFHDATGLWFVRQSLSGTVLTVGYGASGYTPVPADYDGDGQTDIAVYHPPTGLWFVRQSTTGQTFSVGYGGSAFAPVN